MTAEQSIHILYSKIAEDVPDDVQAKCLHRLPKLLRDKHSRYRRWQDRAAYLYSKMLLVRGLEQFGLNYSALEHLQYSEYGRPSLPGSIDFNLSHSGEYMICAIANEIRVGIDIEEIKAVDFSDFTDLMSHDQWRLIRESQDSLKAFFTFWAIKESIIKADGRGLSIPLNNIIITKDTAFYETMWHLKPLQINEAYSAWLASNQENAEIKLEFVDLQDL